MNPKKYPSDLSDAEWESLSPLIPPPKTGGHPRATDMRRVCNGIYYHLKTGCPWQFLPKDFPPPSTVYRYYQKWQKRGILQKMNHALRDRARGVIERAEQPIETFAYRYKESAKDRLRTDTDVLKIELSNS